MPFHARLAAHDRGGRRFFCRSPFLSPCLSPQKAQKNSGPAYDLGTETKVKGTIEEVKLLQKVIVRRRPSAREKWIGNV
jgi:hypothetical protein